MWMVRPSVQREITIDLPDILVESLGDGAELLAQHLTKLAEVGTLDPEHNPPPMPVLCRICERQITPWWFPKHTELCLQEHQADAELQMAQERLTEHRHAIVTVLDALEAQNKRKSLSAADALTPLTTVAPPSRAEYKGQAIGVNSSSGSSSGRESPASSQSGSRERPSSGFSHNRAKSFAVRRPLARIVELILDLCDTAIEINQPTLKESRAQGEDSEVRTQSPQSEGRMSQLIQWQSPGAATLENEHGLAALCDDTSNLARAKVDSVMLCRRILEYSERIRSEYTTLVQDCIDAAMQKAARIVAGVSSSSESEDDEDTDQAPPTDGDKEGLKQGESRPASGIHEVEASLVPTSKRSSAYDTDLRNRIFHAYDGQSAMSFALKRDPSRSPSPQAVTRRVSSAMSNHSGSPLIQQTLQPDSTNQPLPPIEPLPPLELEPPAEIPECDFSVEDDRSIRSSIRAPPRETRSPSMEKTLSRVGSSKESKRKSLILPNRSRSHTRPESPGQGPSQPASPLRINKPRMPSGAFDRAGLTSPTFGSSEFCSPDIPAHVPHHRRQSSATSSEMSRAAFSPRLSMANLPPKAVPPSIKDFEIIKPISKGAFGSVYLAKKKSTGDYFAIKALKKQDMIAKNQVANVKAERAILMFQGESDFVAKLYWTFPSKDYVFLVMEYLNGGDCASLVHSLGTLPEDWAKRYIAEVVLGVDSLHQREIVHRDLKPDNFLVDAKGHLKLTDFGLSRMGLIGRQKRALSKSAGATQAPDPLRQGSFFRSTSMASNRSASFDVQNPPSPGVTPTLTPAIAGHDVPQPSYFSLSRDGSHSGSRERHTSGSQSTLGDVDELQTPFRRFSIYDHGWNTDTARSSPKDFSGKMDGEGHDHVLHETNSKPSQQKVSTPPQASSAMLPPPMALFEPDDSNRRFVGTPDYLAPETINGLGQDEMSDWWSLGCIMFEFLFGYPPFHAPTADQVFENILNRKIDWPEEDEGDASPEAKDLINRLICLDPSQRLGSNMGEAQSSGGEEIKNHPWFSDIDWASLNETEASFIPAPEHVEDTEYFEARGATLTDFAAQFDDQTTSPSTTPMPDFERPHDALTKVRSQANPSTTKRGLMPLHIPPHVRDAKTRRQSEPAAADDFGQFSYKNLPILNRSNQDVIQKLKAEAMQAQSRSAQGTHQQNNPQSGTGSPSPSSLESSPIIASSGGGMPLRRAISTSRGNHRSSSPSTLSHQTSSPSRVSQPSSPLVHFSAGNMHERRKTSSGFPVSQPPVQHQQHLGFFEMPKLATNLSHTSNTSSPVKSARGSNAGDSVGPQPAPKSPRTRSHTVGSSEGEGPPERAVNHQKRRSQAIDISPSSSDTEDPRQKALLRVHRRRQSSRRMSQGTFGDSPVFRALDVLIVEDHPVSRLVMEKLMAKLRCRTMVANHGAQAVAYAMGSVKFDMIMTEFRLPQINGADVARMLRETKSANSNTPVVAVTGYLKDLQAPHHFDALIEKPPTTEKITEVLGRLCQWRAPPPGWIPSSSMPPPLPGSSLRKESYPEASFGGSPTSTASSSLPSIPSMSTNESSRQDSVSSVSTRADRADSAQEDLPKIAKDTSDWSNLGGLGITHNSPPGSRTNTFPSIIPSLPMEKSAPAMLESEQDLEGTRKSPSSEQMEAKRKHLTARARADTGDAADDEDEELGNIGRARSKSPPKSPPQASNQISEARQASYRAKHSSKLSTEMLRTNSQGNVVSPGGTVKPLRSPGPPDLSALTLRDDDAQEHHSGVTPPVFFSPRPGSEAKEFSMDPDLSPEPNHDPDGYFEAQEEQRDRPSRSYLDPQSLYYSSESALTSDPDPTPRLSNSPACDD